MITTLTAILINGWLLAGGMPAGEGAQRTGPGAARELFAVSDHSMACHKGQVTSAGQDV